MRDELASLDQDSLAKLIDQAVQTVEPENVASPAIQRLLQEIRDYRTSVDGAVAPSQYNRVHNRHNRSR